MYGAGNSTCETLVWGKDQSCEFRKKVIEISKRLRCNPNYLMTAMALETGGSFNPAIDNGRGYIGLIQIGKTAAKDINRRKGTRITTDYLKTLTAVQQLEYVEYHLEPKKGKLNTLADFYLAILWPIAVGKGNNPNYIIFDDNNADSKKAYRQNPTFHREKDEFKKNSKGVVYERHGKAGGKTYVWEIAEAIQEWYDRGLKLKNDCSDGTCTLADSLIEGEVCNSCNKIHVDLRSKMTFTPQGVGSSNCGIVARNIIKQLGISCEGYNAKGIAFFQLGLENDDKSDLIFDQKESRNAIEYMNKALDFGHPLRIGVNHTLGGSINERDNPTTDHYVVVVGRKCIDGEIYYQYWDVGTIRGQQESYRFKLTKDNILINENANAGGGTDGREFKVTQIARNIENGKIIEY